MSDLKDFFYDWFGLNVFLFEQVNSISGGFYDVMMKKITLLGDKKLLPYYVAVIAAYAALVLFYKIVTKKSGKAQYFQVWIGIFLVMGAGLLASQITVSKGKEYFAYQRPYAALPANEVRQLEVQEPKDANHSFPSGHVAIITAIIVSLWPVFSGNAYFFAGLTIFSVAWSRMALGVHFPADVLFSFIITFFEVVIIRYMIYGMLRRMFGIRM